jgi:hypothetical protein
MSDEYLWDKSGVPDPEVQRLERVLGTLRHDPSRLFDSGRAGVPQRRSSVPSAPSSGRSALLLIAAALVAAVGAGAFLASSSEPRPGWQVSSLQGAPTVASIGIDGTRPLRVGEWLETDATARARISAGGIGQVDLDPGSRLRLSSLQEGSVRLRLARGKMHALIWAPPGQFFVDTPSSTAVDLGCAYTLSVDDDGSGKVEVTSGWVGFEWKGRESFIPAGAVCLTRPGIGPGTPHYATASSALEGALAVLDFGRVGAEEREAAVTTVLSQARPADAVTLWHLLRRVDPRDSDRVFDRLAGFVPPPAGVTRDGVRAGEREMLDRWWDELGLGSMALWREWQQKWREQ